MPEVKFDPRLSAAVRGRDFASFRAIVDQEPAFVTAFTPFAGGTWLHFAAREGDIDAVRYLLLRGADVNAGDFREGRKAICDAAHGGHAEIVELLLNEGLTLDCSTSVRNPLFSAIVGRSVHVATLLLKHGVDLRSRYPFGEPPVEMDAVAFAVMQGELGIARAIALHAAHEDGQSAQAALDEGRRLAEFLQAPSKRGFAIHRIRHHAVPEVHDAVAE